MWKLLKTSNLQTFFQIPFRKFAKLTKLKEKQKQKIKQVKQSEITIVNENIPTVQTNNVGIRPKLAKPIRPNVPGKSTF
jgi:hypothetical protein